VHLLCHCCCLRLFCDLQAAALVKSVCGSPTHLLLLLLLVVVVVVVTAKGQHHHSHALAQHCCQISRQPWCWI
jgi:hypothetical protein